MADNSKRTGAAIEAHYQFLLWLGPALENFPKDKRFSLGDRIMDHALDVWSERPELAAAEEGRAAAILSNGSTPAIV